MVIDSEDDSIAFTIADNSTEPIHASRQKSVSLTQRRKVETIKQEEEDEELIRTHVDAFNSTIRLWLDHEVSQHLKFE
jgi:hypothetical protein